MSIITNESKTYKIISGEFLGEICVIRRDADKKGNFGVILFSDKTGNKLVSVNRFQLIEHDVPGWPGKFYNNSPCGLVEFLKRDSMYCTLRDSLVSQPSAIKKGEILASGEVVTEEPRLGYNSGVLIKLSYSEWIELAPRLPIALAGNPKFRYPYDLEVSEKLATQCEIVKKADMTKVDWVNIYLNKKSCCIRVPVCTPLALAWNWVNTTLFKETLFIGFLCFFK